MKAKPGGELSAAARYLADWFRQVDRLLRMTRMLGPEAPAVAAQRERIVDQLLEAHKAHAPLVMRCSPLEIWLRDELVVAAPRAEADGPGLNVEQRIPFVLYRNGVRGLTLDANATRGDMETLIDALMTCAHESTAAEDLVTSLWATDLEGLTIEVAPIESTLHVRDGDLEDSLMQGASALLAQQAGGGESEAERAARLDGYDDWNLPESTGDATACWNELRERESAARSDWYARWKAETAQPWQDQVRPLVAQVLRLDNSADTREALATSLVSWLAGAMIAGDWETAREALACLTLTDPDGRDTAATLSTVLSGLDPEAVAERLDEADTPTLARYFGLSVRIGPPILDLTVSILAHANRPKLRAAASTALSYICSEQPQLLARYLADSRWMVVQQIVQVLGQIGGEPVTDLLAIALRHLDVRVRRAGIQALGQVPSARRVPLLLSQLDTTDPQTLHAVLHLLGRDDDPRIARALLERVNALDFEGRPNDMKLTLLAALGEYASDEAVPALEAMLLKGGWLARRTPERTAAAMTLGRIATPSAEAVLERGMRSRAEAVRQACADAMRRREQAA